MSTTEKVTTPTKGRSTSIPLLIAFGVLGVAAYFAGPTVMAYAFFYQEQALSKANYESARNSNSQRQLEAGPNPGMPTTEAALANEKPEAPAPPVTEESAKETPKE